MRIKHRGKITEAHKWFRNGDHPEDRCEIFTESDSGYQFWGEGQVVRYYRMPSVDGKLLCQRCGYQMHIHGYIEGDKRGAVCPGDWIVKDGNNYKSYPSGFFTEPDDLEIRGNL